ncbi:flagellar basal body-associated FliL family protein [Rhodobium gokarnense]|uniref:Flagellar protein FliL n=1 Tax=Rhodobium gokarnense TaxID=364296 RepID=A0ABT3HD47_9HYPH|nr:flagellar basal body-associated FliL family protein [Rhodobium gokarnense]MCW2308328.1 flagellar FliL protein [Rhodobium gokarnense]
MAEDDAQTDELEEGAEGKPSGKRKLILFGAIGFLVLGGGAAAFLLGLFDSGPPEADTAQQEVQQEVYFYDLPELTVNLSTIDNRNAYLKMRISLEVDDQSVANKIEPYLPRILDTFQVYLRELRSTDLRGSSGLFRLKEELHRRINIAIYPAKVNDVLFKQLIIQ